MTKVTYVMENGSIANSLKEAQAIGGAYKVAYEDLPETSTLSLTPKMVAKMVKASLN